MTNSNASSNARDGISAANGVVAFCRARSNGQQNIDAAGATLTGNNANPETVPSARRPHCFRLGGAMSFP